MDCNTSWIYMLGQAFMHLAEPAPHEAGMHNHSYGFNTTEGIYKTIFGNGVYFPTLYQSKSPYGEGRDRFAESSIVGVSENAEYQFFGTMDSVMKKIYKCGVEGKIDTKSCPPESVGFTELEAVKLAGGRRGIMKKRP